MKINGITIPHPVTFTKKKPTESRAGATPTFSVKRTVIHKPASPKAKYAMPFVAVVAAVATFSAGAAIATAAGATIAAMVAGGAMMVGAAATVVGTVTGNKNLVKYGGILSAVGGIGAIGLSLTGNLTSAAAEAAGGAAADAASGAANAADAASGAANAAAPTSSAPQTFAAGDAIDAAGQTVKNAAGGGLTAVPDAGVIAPAQAVPTAVDQAATSLPDVAPPAQAATDLTANANQAAVSNPLSAQTNTLNPDINNTLTDTTDTQKHVNLPGKPNLPNKPMAQANSPGILEWIRKNPEAAKIASQTVGGVMSAIPSPQQRAQSRLTDEQIVAAQQANELNRQRSYWRSGRKAPKAG